MREAIRQIWKMINKQNRKKLIGVSVVTLVSTMLEMVGVSLIVPIATAITSPDIIDTDSLLGKVCKFLHIGDIKTLMCFCLVALIVVYIIKNIVYVLNNYLQVKFVCDCRLDTQRRLLKSFLYRDYEYYLNASSGDIVRIIYSDAIQTFDLLRSLISMCSELLVSLGLVATIFLIDWQMTVYVAILLLVVAAIVVRVIRPILKREGTAFQTSSTQLYNWLIQIIDGIKMIKVSERGMFFERKFQKSARNRNHSEEINAFLGSVPRMMIEVISICSIIGYILMKILLGTNVELLLPALCAFAMAAVKLMPGANRIVCAINAIAYNRPAVVQVYNNLFINQSADENNSDSKNVEGIFSKQLELRELTYSYPGTSKLIFDNSEVIINRGDTIGIVGASGSGKTTLVDILLGLLRPQSGKILIDGEENDINNKTQLFSVGYIPQFFFLLDDTIKANIAFGIEDNEIDEEKVKTVIQEAQLEEYVNSLPEGIYTNIGEKGIRLSGGQRQRIGIARALYHNPDLLIFDEATSALDNETEQAVMDAIGELKGRKTMIIIAHRTNTLNVCDSIYRIENAKIIKEK